MKYRIRRRQILALLPMLIFALTACGSGQNGNTSNESQTTVADPAPDTNPAQSTGGPGIDQTKIDVCAKLPRGQVEAAIGPLVEDPKPSISIGSEVGCDYVVDQGRGYGVTIYNLDRWDLIPQTLDVTPVPDLGDGAYLQRRDVDGSHQLFVLVRDRAVVGVSVNGADTPQLRQLLDLALDSVRE